MLRMEKQVTRGRCLLFKHYSVGRLDMLLCFNFIHQQQQQQPMQKNESKQTLFIRIFKYIIIIILRLSDNYCKVYIKRDITVWLYE